jgi:cytochrome c oxidase subunit II
VISTLTRRTRSLAAITGVTLAQLLLASPALADTATPEPPASPPAVAMNDVFLVILGVTITIFILVGGWLLYSAIRFRERPDNAHIEPPQMHGSTKLEIGWTIVPILIVLGLAGYTAAKLPDTVDAPSNSMVIHIRAQQFSWTVTYPGGRKPPAADASKYTLIAPVDTPVKLELTSKDVIHDWWVPELGAKIDVFPYRTTSTWFKAEHTGLFRGQCAEFCGSGHSTMLINVLVVSRGRFDQMMSGGA